MFKGVIRDVTPVASEAGKLKTGLDLGDPESCECVEEGGDEDMDGKRSSVKNVGDKFPGEDDGGDTDSKLDPKEARPLKLVGLETPAVEDAVSALCCC